jgi:hypothetical protein
MSCAGRLRRSLIRHHFRANASCGLASSSEHEPWGQNFALRPA